MKELFVVYLKFKSKWEACIFILAALTGPNQHLCCRLDKQKIQILISRVDASRQDI
jgi:hypothetical protein